MDSQAAAVLGVWLFATATAISKQVNGGFMFVAFVVAIFVTKIIL
jgi:hypothetical protein